MRISFILIFCFFNFFLHCQKEIISLEKLLKDQSKNPLICGHRGGYYVHFPENSLSVIEYIYKANKESPLMIEIDVRKDKDGILWILHDKELERTTNGMGYIDEKNTEELKKLFLKSQNGLITKERIPTLKSLLNYIKDKNIYLMLDIKEQIYHDVIKEIEASQLDDRCIILTFNPESTQKVIAHNNKSHVSVLVNSNKDYNKFINLDVPKDRLLAYVTDKTDTSVINFLKKDSFLSLSDSREVWNKKYQPFTQEYYTSLIYNFNLNLLVTDFPIEVSKMIGIQD